MSKGSCRVCEELLKRMNDATSCELQVLGRLQSTVIREAPSMRAAMRAALKTARREREEAFQTFSGHVLHHQQQALSAGEMPGFDAA